MRRYPPANQARLDSNARRPNVDLKGLTSGLAGDRVLRCRASRRTQVSRPPQVRCNARVGRADGVWSGTAYVHRPLRTTTVTCATRGAISLSSSSHFSPLSNSPLVNPVILPPGLAKLATKPLTTGSLICTNTIGMVRVASRAASNAGWLLMNITSGVRPTNSVAERLPALAADLVRRRSELLPPHFLSCIQGSQNRGALMRHIISSVYGAADRHLDMRDGDRYCGIGQRRPPLAAGCRWVRRSHNNCNSR